MYDKQRIPTIRDGFENEHLTLIGGMSMLQKFKSTSYATILFLFGLTLISESPAVYALQGGNSMDPSNSMQGGNTMQGGNSH